MRTAYKTAQNASCNVTVSFSNTESYAVSGITLMSMKFIHRDRSRFIADALDRYDLETYEIQVYILYINHITIRILFFEQKSIINKRRSNRIRKISGSQYNIKTYFPSQKAPEPYDSGADFL